MIRSFTSFTLTSEQTALVFPLVQTRVPGIDLPAWRNFSRSLIEGEPASRSGAIGIRNDAGYACGLLVYRVLRDLRRGSVLAMDLFIALDLLDEQAAMQALLQAAEAKARELGCMTTQIHVEPAQKSLADCFLAAGHSAGARVLFKQLDPAPLPI